MKENFNIFGTNSKLILIYSILIQEKSMSKLNEHLRRVQNTEESFFPMDSVSTSKKPLKVGYPNESTNLVNRENGIPKRVMVDFDGVIHSYEKGYQDGNIYGTLNPGTREALEKLKDDGFEIVVFTARVSPKTRDDAGGGKGDTWKEQYLKIADWLMKNNIPFKDITSEKLAAVAYIDDRAIHFDGDWEDVIQKLT